MFDEEVAGQYPPLPACVVIDARFSSRSELAQELRNSRLFSEITEASSVNDGLRLLQNTHYDAAILGPTLSLERTVAFLKETENVPTSSDCAFIVIVLCDEDKNVLDSSGRVHSTILQPYASSEFSAGIIDAVVVANKTSPWATVREKLTSGHQSTPASSGDFVSRALANSISGLKEIADGADRGEYGLTPAGIPTMKTQAALKKIVLLITSQAASSNRDISELNTFLEKSLTEWFEAYLYDGSKEATKRLRDTLLEFSKLESQS